MAVEETDEIDPLTVFLVGNIVAGVPLRIDPGGNLPGLPKASAGLASAAGISWTSPTAVNAPAACSTATPPLAVPAVAPESPATAPAAEKPSNRQATRPAPTLTSFHTLFTAFPSL